MRNVKPSLVKRMDPKRIVEQAKSSLPSLRERVNQVRCYIEMMPDFERGLLRKKFETIDTAVDEIEKLLNHGNDLFTTTGVQETPLGS